MKHRFLETNGINMHVAEQGEGELVLLCHGFPECWYSWRHQLPALAAAGYRAVAPDQRGYGLSDRPFAVDAYDILQLTADMVNLVQALGHTRAAIVGHDWGTVVAWFCALLRPDLFDRVVLLSVPYRPRSRQDIRPTDKMKQMAGEDQFYQLYFQEPDKAEAELEADVRKSLLMLLYSASAEPSPQQQWRIFFDKSERLLDSITLPENLPSWLTEQDLDYFTQTFEQTGFRGGLNWYRNLDRMWELTPFLCDAKLQQPSLFVGGEVDALTSMYWHAYDSLETAMPNLTKKVLLPGAGHWIQQERPTQVNELLIEFLQGVSSVEGKVSPSRFLPHVCETELPHQQRPHSKSQSSICTDFQNSALLPN